MSALQTAEGKIQSGVNGPEKENPYKAAGEEPNE